MPEDKSLMKGALENAMGDDVFNIQIGDDLAEPEDTTTQSQTPTPQTPPDPSGQSTSEPDPGTPEDDVDTDTDGDGSQPAGTPTNVAPILKELGAMLAEKGIISFNEDEFSKAKDPDTFFEEQVTNTINQRVEDAIKAKEAEWPEEVAKLVELSKKGVPLHAILESDARIASLEGIDIKEIESNAELQKDILQTLYESQGFTTDRAAAKVKRAEDLGSLKDDAMDGFDILLTQEKKAKEELIKAEQAKATRAKEERDARLNQIVSDIKNAKEIIPGLPLSEADKTTLINGITKATATDKQGRPINALQKARLEDPAMDYKVAYFTLILKGDLSKLNTKATTKTARSLKNIIDSQEPLHGAAQGGQGQPSKSTVDKVTFKNALAAFRKQQA